MRYYRYNISCINTDGKLIGFVIYKIQPDIVTVVEYIEATKGYTIVGMLVIEEVLYTPPIETPTTVLLHE